MGFYQDVADFAASVKGLTRDGCVHRAADKLIKSAEKRSDAAYEMLDRVAAPGEAKSEPVDINSPDTTVKQLKAEAARRGVAVKSGWKKQDIIDALSGDTE